MYIIYLNKNRNQLNPHTMPFVSIPTLLIFLVFFLLCFFATWFTVDGLKSNEYFKKYFMVWFIVSMVLPLPCVVAVWLYYNGHPKPFPLLLCLNIWLMGRVFDILFRKIDKREARHEKEAKLEEAES